MEERQTKFRSEERAKKTEIIRHWEGKKDEIGREEQGWSGTHLKKWKGLNQK